MDTERNRQRVTEAFAAMEERQDWRPLFALVDRSVQWTVIGDTWISGTYDGLDAFRECMRAIGEVVPEPVRVTVRNIFADGAHVIVLWDGAAKTRDGEAYDNRYAWVFRFEGERIVEVTAYLDTDLIRRVLRR
jgi:ketosteroid isomerase-like protein